ncbi:hypothetical protein [Halotia branconii]|uniref:Uncharacterized protein n=1 Tax=Halotia branconii CENA392 TaxID=1539056 RepID=A0AAJ6NTU0_9CYAN|nr:hypothetical protein [Halotia branconii]WGV26283.1 hypothetical protein QI031_01850 [Halotia branconii CENA392]
MTTSVADKTPISDKTWRRHTDPPSLWIVVAISSVSLHLLAFWFIRSSNIFRPWFPQQSQAVVPIEFVEISSQAKPKLTVKKVTPKPSKASQQSVPSRLPKTTQTTPKNQTSDVVSSEDTTLNSSKTEVSQPPRGKGAGGREQGAEDRSSKTEVSQANTPLFPQKIVSTPTPTPTSTIPVGDLPWNRRQEIKLGRGKPLPTGVLSVPSEQTRRPETEQEQIPGIPGEETTSTLTGESSRIPGEETTSTLTGESSRIPGEETTSTLTGENSRIPGEETTPTPTGENSRIPGEETTPTPTGENSRIPGEETTPTPTGESSRIPGKETTSTPTGESSRVPGEETASTPTGESSRIPGKETTSTPTGESSRVPRQGGSIAIVTPLSKNEVLQLIQEGRLRHNDLPDVLAKYQGNNRKTLDSSFLPGDSEIQPAQLLTSLVIDENGKFQQVEILEIEPTKPQSEKILYEKVINELFSNENFMPAHNQDGTKPPTSNIFIKVTIKPVNSN